MQATPLSQSASLEHGWWSVDHFGDGGVRTCRHAPIANAATNALTTTLGCLEEPHPGNLGTSPHDGEAPQRSRSAPTPIEANQPRTRPPSAWGKNTFPPEASA